MFDFQLTTKLHEKTWPEFVKEFALGKRDLLVTNRPILGKYLESSKLECHVVYQEDYGRGEPSDKMINLIGADLKGIEYDRVIGIGGGTVIDVCKALVLESTGDILDIILRRVPAKRVKGLVIVPTTCGTGSEVTWVTVIEDTNDHIKKGIESWDVCPEHAVLIPELLQSAPYKVLAGSSIDALIHAIEAFVSPFANPITELFGVRAIEMILPAYQQIAEQGEKALYANLSDLLLSSTYAGISFTNAGVGTVHAMSGQLGAGYHVPHGESNYVLLDVVLRMYDKKAPNGRMKDLKAVFSNALSLPAGANVLDELKDLLEKVYPSKRLHEYGMKEEEIDLYSEATMLQPHIMKNACVPLSREEIREIYANQF